MTIEKDMEKLEEFDRSNAAERKRKKLQMSKENHMWGLTKGKEKNSNLQTMFVGVRFGVFLHNRVQSVHTFTVAVAILIEDGSIEAKEWNARNCLMANQKKQKSNNSKHWHICIDVPPFALLSDLSRYQRTN